MSKKDHLIGQLALLLLALLLAGCTQSGADVEPPPTLTPGPGTPQEVLAAQRAVLAFLREGANECVPPPGVTWDKKQGAAPEGFAVYRFDSEGCLMTVSYPLPASAETQYHVTVHNGVTGFCWQANVDAEGSVTATGLDSSLLPDLTNAAAAYCVEQGHAYEVREQSDGSKCGYCIFEDGESCNAWAYFQGMCEE